MGKTIKRPNPFARYEFEYLESYLEEKARQGRILKKAGRWVLTFEEDEPREIKYRMIPETGIVDKEELESFEERGWKVVGKENMPMLANEDTGLEEPFPSENDFKKRAENFLLDMRINTVSEIVCIIALGAMFLWKHSWSTLHFIEMHRIAEMVTYDLFIFTVMLMIIAETAKCIRILQKFRNGSVHSGSFNGDRRAKSNIIFRTVFVILFAAMIAVMIWPEYDSDESAGTIKEQLAESRAQLNNKEISRPLSFKVFDKKRYDYLVNYFEIFEKEYESGKVDEEDDDLPYYDRTKENNFLFKTKCCENAYVDPVGDNGEWFQYDATYLEARSEWIAKRYLHEEIEWMQEQNAKKIKFDLPGADYAGYKKDEYGYKYLYLRKNNCVEFIRYYGDKDLKKNAKSFLNDILLYGTWKLCGFVEEGKRASKDNILSEKDYYDNYGLKMPENKITLHEKGIVANVPGTKREQLKRTGESKYTEKITITVIDKKKLSKPIIQYTDYILKDGYLFAETTYSDKTYSGGGFNVYKKVE